MKFFVVAIFNFLALTYATHHEKSGCLEKEKALALLETADDLLSKAGDSLPSCREDINSTDNSTCEAEKPLAYLEVARKLVSDVRENFPTCPKPIDKDDKIVEYEKPIDCSELLARGNNQSGVYTVWPREPYAIRKSLKVYCDMKTDRGGWTVIQRRGKFPVQQDFYQDWETYKKGFGNLTEEFWLGNENIRVLCLKGCELRVDLQAENGEKRFAHYQSFNLSSGSYRLGLSGYSGNAPDSFIYHHDRDFSTKDKGDTACAKSQKGAWWYKSNLDAVYLNGIYEPGKTGKQYVFWYGFRKYENLASTEMKVKPK